MRKNQTKEEERAARRREAAAKGVHTRRTNAMNKKMNAILETMPEDQRFIAKELADNFVFLSVRITELREALLKQPSVISYDNGGGQTGFRENPNISVYNKLVTRHADLCMKLAKLLPEEADDAKDELEAFIGL